MCLYVASSRPVDCHKLFAGQVSTNPHVLLRSRSLLWPTPSSLQSTWFTVLSRGSNLCALLLRIPAQSGILAWAVPSSAPHGPIQAPSLPRASPPDVSGACRMSHSCPLQRTHAVRAATLEVPRASTEPVHHRHGRAPRSCVSKSAVHPLLASFDRDTTAPARPWQR